MGNHCGHKCRQFTCHTQPWSRGTSRSPAANNTISRRDASTTTSKRGKQGMQVRSHRTIQHLALHQRECRQARTWTPSDPPPTLVYDGHGNTSPPRRKRDASLENLNTCSTRIFVQDQLARSTTVLAAPQVNKDCPLLESCDLEEAYTRSATPNRAFADGLASQGSNQEPNYVFSPLHASKAEAHRMGIDDNKRVHMVVQPLFHDPIYQPTTG